MAFITERDDVLYLITSGPTQNVVAGASSSESAMDLETILTQIPISLEGPERVLSLRHILARNRYLGSIIALARSAYYSTKSDNCKPRFDMGSKL